MFKKISSAHATIMRNNRDNGLSNTDMFADIKRQYGIPSDHKLAIEINDTYSPDYLVIKNKHTRLGYCQDGSMATSPATAAPIMADDRVRITPDELEQLHQTRVGGYSNKPVFAAIKARLNLHPDVKLKVEIDETGDPDYCVLKTKDGQYVYEQAIAVSLCAATANGQYSLPGIAAAPVADQDGDGQDDSSHRIRTLIGGLIAGLASPQDGDEATGANITVNIDHLIVYELHVGK